MPPIEFLDMFFQLFPNKVIPSDHFSLYAEYEYDFKEEIKE